MTKSRHTRNAWLVIFVSALFLVYKYVLQVSPSIMTNSLMRAFHIAGTGLGNLAATFFYSYFITQLFVGVLLDKFSVRWLPGLAIAVSAFGAYVFASAHSIVIAECGRALMGLGAAFATVSYMKNAANWFAAERFAFVGGLLATAAMLGAVFGQAPLSLVVQHYSWRSSLNLVALFGVLVMLLYLIVVRDRPSQFSDASLIDTKLTWRDFVTVLRKSQNWLLTFYSGLAFAPIAVFGGLWGVPFLEAAHHLQATEAASLTSSAFIGLAFGGPLLGLLSDRIKKRRIVMLVGTLLSFVMLLLIIYIDVLPYFVVLLLMFLFGFGTGAFMLGFALGKDINCVSLAATIIALINTGDAIFGAISEPLVGKFLDMGWTGDTHADARIFSVHDYHMALILLPVYLLFALVLTAFIKDVAHH